LIKSVADRGVFGLEGTEQGQGQSSDLGRVFVTEERCTHVVRELSADKMEAKSLAEGARSPATGSYPTEVSSCVGRTCASRSWCSTDGPDLSAMIKRGLGPTVSAEDRASTGAAPGDGIGDGEGTVSISVGPVCAANGDTDDDEELVVDAIAGTVSLAGASSLLVLLALF
jgi:hypothetical protein